MKRVYWILALAATLLLAASCGQTKAQKALVLYYSQSSTTKAVAEQIASLLDADLEAFVLEEPYDGTYQETIERSGRERSEGILPKVNPIQADLAAYDVIFLGYPIWFGTYAPPIAAWLAQVDLAGKKIVPFCTFGSGGLDSSINDLKAKQPKAEILPGYGVRAARIAAMPEEVELFLKANGFLKGDFTPLEDFSDPHPASEAETAIFDAAVGTYPMINATAVTAASRAIPGGTEYLFTAADKPREGMPPMPAGGQMKVYVTAKDGQAPEFTQVVR